MTENIYGMLKRRFPITKYIRSHLLNSIRIVQACVVLHNIALDYRDEVPQNNHPNYHEEVEEEDSMDNTPTRKELVKMANHRVQAEIRRRARR